MAIHKVDGDLLDHDAMCIAHQCNCVSEGASGIAGAIFDKFPYSDVYSDRTEPSKPGTIKICGNWGQPDRYVINMFSQYYPGTGNPDNDNKIHRIKWFAECLVKIGKIEGCKSVAFPYLIGCGLAGGDWVVYERVLERFAAKYPDIEVYIVKLED